MSPRINVFNAKKDDKKKQSEYSHLLIWCHFVKLVYGKQVCVNVWRKTLPGDLGSNKVFDDFITKSFLLHLKLKSLNMNNSQNTVQNSSGLSWFTI